MMNTSVRSSSPRPLAAVFGACALLLLAGCHNNASTRTTGNTAPPADGKTHLAFVTNGASDYWKLCGSGVAAASKELGNVDVQFIEPADASAATQKQDIDDLMSKGVKGIAISPIDPANQTDYLNGIAAKTNLITSDSDAPASNRLCYLGTDNHAAGLQAGGLIKQSLPQGGKIMLFVGKSDAQNAKDRIGGIQDALKGSNITIVDTRTDDQDHARAKQNAADAIVGTPDLAGMVGIYSYDGPAIYSAVKGANKQGKIKIIAFDQEVDTMTGVKDGAISGAIVQQPYQFGYQCVKLLAKLASGDKSVIPANKMIIVPTQIINKDNIAKYEADQAKLMGGA